MKQTVAVIFGGRSTEHDISIITALASIIRPLRADDRYNVLPVYITKDGEWYADEKLGDVTLYQSGRIKQTLSSTKRVWIEAGNGLTLVKPGIRPVRTKIDVVFPAMHGTNGEDGALMGLLQMADVPFVGCDMASSVIAMDKVLCKQVVSAAGIDVVKAVTFTKQQYAVDASDLIKDIHRLELPLFVKPAHLGSSIGISRIKSYDEIKNAIEVALHYDTVILVEEAVKNLIEVTVPVIGNDSPRAALVEKPLAKSDTFFDFETKYIRDGGKKSGGSKSAQGYSELPAQLPGDLYQKSIDTALRAYKSIGCSGIARIDLLIDSKSNTVYLNEVNPLPGSLYAHNWQRAGTPPINLVNELIDLALERFDTKKKLESTFSTSFLKQF